MGSDYDVMMLFFQKSGDHLFRYVVLAGVADKPDDAEWLSVGEWCIGIEAARNSGFAEYFRLYASRYGFRHPEDPNVGTWEEAPDDVRVLLYTDNDSVFQSHTRGHAHPVH